MNQPVVLFLTFISMLAPGGCVSWITQDAFENLVIENYSNPRHGWHKAGGEETQNPIAPDSRSLHRGQELFIQYCSPCHGPDGKGTEGPAVRDLPRPPANLVERSGQRSDYFLYLQISMGRDGMPMWRTTLTERDRWDIVNHLRTLSVATP